jgi:hypothetical protein
VVTMVEEEEYEFMGHLMLSPITIEGQEGPWLGLAPVAVHPDWQGRALARIWCGKGWTRHWRWTGRRWWCSGSRLLRPFRLSACQRLRPALHLRGADGVFHGDGVATRRARRKGGEVLYHPCSMKSRWSDRLPIHEKGPAGPFSPCPSLEWTSLGQ